MTVTYGEGLGIFVGGIFITFGVILSVCRFCCGDNIFWRAVNKCQKKKPSDTETQSSTNINSFNCCGGSTTIHNSQSKGNPPISEETAIPSALPEDSNTNRTQQGSKVSQLLPPPIVNNQPAVNPSGSNQTVHPSAPLEENNENAPLLPPPNLTSESPSTAAISDQPDSQTSQTISNQPRQQSTTTDEVVTRAAPGSIPSASIVTVADVHQGSAAGEVVTRAAPGSIPSASRVTVVDVHQGSGMTTEHSSATSDEVDSRPIQVDPNQPQQQSTVSPPASASWTNSYQLQQQSTEPVTMPPSSVGPSSALQQANKKSFSAKFVRDLGAILDPSSPLNADWRLILIQLGQSQSQINSVTRSSNPTEEALHRWASAGRSLDDLLEVYKMKRPDASEVIETYKKNNEAYSAISPKIAQQTPRHGNAIVTMGQLSKLAHNLGPWDELAINLGMSTGDIYKFKENHKNNQWAQAYYMLDKWRSREYRNATVGSLYEICCKIKTIDHDMYAFLLE